MKEVRATGLMSLRHIPAAGINKGLECIKAVLKVQMLDFKSHLYMFKDVMDNEDC